MLLHLILTFDRKPKNARTARIVKARTESKLIEDRKRVLVLHGTRCPDQLNAVLKTVASLAKPHAVLLHKKNENIHPFETAESLEFLAGKNDCGLVVFGNSSKKRPNAVTITRIFDGKTLDMCELLLLPPTDGAVQPARAFQVGVEMKPMILFAGNVWDDTSATEQSTKFTMIKSLLLDVFQGEEIKTIDVEGLQYLMMIAAPEPEAGQEPIINVRWYKVRTKKSGQKLPRVEVDEIGPKFDFRAGRIKEADSSIWKEAMKRGRRPDEAKKRKNIDMDTMGDKVGRVHLGRQDLGTLQTRKMKGLKKSHDFSDDEDADMDGMQDEEFEGNDDDEGSAVEFDGVDFGDEDVSQDEGDGGMDLDEEESQTNGKKRRLR
ncbi:putative ribosome biogenesis [Phaeomoniella chlamydospora]|uniref:Ribosome production factor 2 homolog n=1 Tax=Phaeomoniella chlamydospora TaxID=158046 RepID=A0A0G2G4U1_PHACM|nr:putative ribosome biogenesis [Phaeomoniella chlamydospora]